MLRQLFSRTPDDAIPDIGVTVADAAARAGHLRLVDVRGPDEFAAGHPAGSVNVPLAFTCRSGLAPAAPRGRPTPPVVQR